MFPVGVISYSIAAVAFFGLTALLFVSRQRGRHGWLLMVATSTSCVWAIVGAMATLPDAQLFWAGGLSETLRILAWAAFIRSIIVLAGTDSQSTASTNRRAPTSHTDRRLWFPAVALAVCTVQFGSAMAARHGLMPSEWLSTLLPSLWISTCLIALVFLEQLYRFTAPSRRHAIRYLCLGLGAMLLFDFIVFTDTLLFRRVQLDLWQARGAVYGFLVPLIALSVARNPNWALRLHVSRQAVTSSVAVLGAGAYLLATALAATLIRYSGIEWAGVAEIALIVLAVVGLITLALSRSLRSSTRVLVSKHLFSYKYDYRHEWLNFTQTLANNPDDAAKAIVRGMTSIVESEAGALWSKTGGGRQELMASHGFGGLDDIVPAQFDALDSFLGSTNWLIDIDEYRAHPERYDDLLLPDAFVSNTAAWLIVPLPFRESVIGFVLIARSRILKRINWEDRDLLKTAGHQAAGLLAQKRASEALSEARQFEAFSKLSAYIVHDLKNILGQQSLIVSNAAKHKHKPEFVDDVIATIDNSVKRMHGLLDQLRTQQAQTQDEPMELAELLQEAIDNRQSIKPRPVATKLQADLYVRVQRDKLLRVFSHLIQNAQESCSADDAVTISLWCYQKCARIVITDTGSGMDESFIRDRLFKPFESTKGLTGMGIGVYESREYVRSLGGEVSVESEAGKGTVFTVTLPLEHAILVATSDGDAKEAGE